MLPSRGVEGPVGSRFVWTVDLNTWSRGTHASYTRKKKRAGTMRIDLVGVTEAKIEEQVEAMVRGARKRMTCRERRVHRRARGTKVKRGKVHSLPWTVYCFCIPVARAREPENGGRKTERRVDGAREGYRLLEICIFVGHTVPHALTDASTVYWVNHSNGSPRSSPSNDPETWLW